MVSSRAWWWCLPAILLVGCANADDEIDDLQDLQSGLVCGMEVLPSPQTVPATACEDGRSVLGPVRVERTTGQSETQLAFQLDSPNDVCVTLTSSEKGKGFVFLDGDRIAKPELFNEHGGGEQTLPLEAGSHDLLVKMVGKPGEHVDVEIQEAFGSLDTGLDITNADGSLRLTNVAVDHPLLTPNGDGHHDDTFFNADVEPLNTLPGKDDGSVDYFLQWEFTVVDLGTCATVDTGITGTTQVNSPTRVTATWDGTDTFGAVVPDGTYAYVFDVTLVDEFGVSFGSIESPAFGIIVDSAPADHDEVADYAGMCNPASDPANCRCPGSGGVPGTMDPNCSFGFIQHLLDETGLGPFDQNYYDPSLVDLSFIATSQDPATGRYEVTVDLRNYAAGGLVRKGDGVWDSEADLRQWVSDMTGVPVSTGDSLFNFDYVQLGTSTGVTIEPAPAGGIAHSFNHFLLDAMTDADGQIHVAGVTTDLAALFNDDSTAPSQFTVNGRSGDECTTGGNTNGVDSLKSSYCAYNTAVPIGGTSVGVYALRSSLFGIDFNGATSTQDELCVINGIWSCGVRTVRVPADTLDIEASYYVEVGAIAQFTRTDTVSLAGAAGVSLAADRGDGEDGVCGRAVATRDGLAVRMDSADGTVPDTCVINGVIPY